MSVLVEGKTISSTGSFVASYFEWYCYISRLDFISILAYFYSQTPRKYWELLFFLFLFCFAHISSRKENKTQIFIIEKD